MRQGEFFEEPRDAPVDRPVALTTGLLAQRTGEVGLADAGRAGDQDVMMLGDPLARGELPDRGAVQVASRRVVDAPRDTRR